MADTVFDRERETIIAIRKANPTVGAWTLAKQIREGKHNSGTAKWRPFLSTYSVIRRYDAKEKAAVATILGGKSVVRA